MSSLNLFNPLNIPNLLTPYRVHIEWQFVIFSLVFLVLLGYVMVEFLNSGWVWVVSTLLLSLVLLTFLFLVLRNRDRIDEEIITNEFAKDRKKQGTALTNIENKQNRLRLLKQTSEERDRLRKDLEERISKTSDTEEQRKLGESIEALNNTEKEIESIAKTSNLQTEINNLNNEIREDRTKQAVAERELRNYDPSFRQSLENNLVNQFNLEKKMLENELSSISGKSIPASVEGFSVEDRVNADAREKQREALENKLRTISAVTGETNSYDIENNHNKILLNLNDNLQKRGISQKELNDREGKIEDLNSQKTAAERVRDTKKTDLDTSQEKLSDAKVELKEAKKQLLKTKKEYDEGSATAAELKDAEKGLLKAEKDLESSKIEEIKLKKQFKESERELQKIESKVEENQEERNALNEYQKVINSEKTYETLEKGGNKYLTLLEKGDAKNKLDNYLEKIKIDRDLIDEYDKDVREEKSMRESRLLRAESKLQKILGDDNDGQAYFQKKLDEAAANENRKIALLNQRKYNKEELKEAAVKKKEALLAKLGAQYEKDAVNLRNKYEKLKTEREKVLPDGSDKLNFYTGRQKDRFESNKKQIEDYLEVKELLDVAAEDQKELITQNLWDQRGAIQDIISQAKKQGEETYGINNAEYGQLLENSEEIKNWLNEVARVKIGEDPVASFFSNNWIGGENNTNDGIGGENNTNDGIGGEIDTDDDDSDIL